MRRAIMSSLLALVLHPDAAHAAWLEASSAHFVVYTDDTESDLRRFSERLERYHAAMAAVTTNRAPEPSPSNRVTVYVVRSEEAFRELHGGKNRFVGGFYIPQAGGSFAIVPQVSSGPNTMGTSMTVLLHEYAHHFLISSSSMSAPRWFTEGSAEFFAACSFKSDGSVMLGMAAQHRAPELFNAPDVKVADLLDSTEYDKRKRRNYDAFYGKSWLLYHYLTFNRPRDGQLTRYLDLLAQGKGLREAALTAFGDFDVLERELEHYMRQRLTALDLPASMVKIGPIALRRLSAGEAAMMPVRIRSRRGVMREQATALIGQARAIAARFPSDPAVLSALAEAEYDAGNDKEAIAAADTALAADPSQVNAYIQKGYALFRMAEDAKDSAGAYRRARAPFIALNRRENDHPIPLIYFYRSFTEQGQQPTQLAIDGLIQAMTIAPFDLGLRMTLAMQLIQSGRQVEAGIVLKPVAFSPHGEGLADQARRLLARLASEPTWRGDDMGSVLAGPAEAGERSPDGASTP